jgi:hypothetical protein
MLSTALATSLSKVYLHDPHPLRAAKGPCPCQPRIRPTEAAVLDANAKDLAAKRLARLAESETVKGDTKLTTPARVISRPAERQPETPEQLRARVRASLMRRRA